MKTLILISALMVAASAHLCLLCPHQRGTMEDLNTAGATDCGLEDAPCGKRNKSMKGQTTIFHPDSNVSIVFQKNLDHFNAATPGAFIVNLCHSENDCTQLMKVADSADAKSGYIYTPTITIAPDTKVGEAMLQVNYMTSNPQAPANFYQCADVMIAKRGV